MATIKQKRVAKLMIDNLTMDNPLNGGQMLEKVSYSKGMQKQPSRILQSEGVKEALREYGLTEELVTIALVDDINNKPKNRLGELRLAAEILNMNDHEVGGNKTLIINITGETATRYGITPESKRDSS